MAGNIILFPNKRKRAPQMTAFSFDAMLDTITIPLVNTEPVRTGSDYLPKVGEGNTAPKYSSVNPYTEEDEKIMAEIFDLRAANTK